MSAQAKMVVGIGASAGGLEALSSFFRRLPADTGVAFVVVTHLARGHASSLPDILSRYTDMPVSSPVEDTAIEPDQIYVAPADVIWTISEGKIQVEARQSDIQRRPIDVFLSSLATAYSERAIGIILSGGGSDGTLGMKAIKEHGGLTLAQGSDGSSPMQSSMPETAIAAGVVDLVLPVEKMAGWVTKVAQSADRLDDLAGEDAEAIESASENGKDPESESYDVIFRLLLNQVGHDFSGYKTRTFARRVRRRMQVRQIHDLKGYVEYLKREPDEVSALFRDLLIGVTDFFRDPGAFETLGTQVIPRLFEDRGVSETVRVWVPGCATGEEVYSIAIMMREHIETLRTSPKVQIFATDIDEVALNVARAGRYPAQLLEKVTPQRLQRYFSGDDVSYAVNKNIRDMCVFSSHSVIRDPPFSRIDLISCRNLLIYLGTEFQAQVIPVFHFALRPGGYLFLGTSENVSQHSDLFTPVDKKQRIFQRRDHVAAPVQFSIFAPSARRTGNGGGRNESAATAVANLRRAVEMRVMERFAPAHLIINRDGDILHYSARTGKYLEPAAGLPNRHLMAMARRGLRLELRAVMREAMENRKAVSRRQIPVEMEDRVQHVDVTMEPFGDNEHDPLFLVLFSDTGAPQEQAARSKEDTDGERTADRLETDLRDTRERLQATIEEYETAVEELKSSNEELQSMNEELQSTNEEMETSKEELQSVNEELQTVNSELNAKVEEVDRVNADLRNVFDSTRIATIFLDSKLVVRSFTPAVTKIFNLISTDRGRPLTDIANHLESEFDLQRDIQTVLERGESIERPVRHTGGNHYLMRILPYHLTNKTMDGVLLTFNDVTNLSQAEEQQRTMVEELNHRVRNMLMVVGAIAKRTLARSEKPEQFVEAFLGRLDAMANSYGLVSRERWTPISLRELLLTELAAYQREHPGRVALKGPDISVPPAEAIALGMIFHELTTNAAKYGALSRDKGHVSVEWDMHSDFKLDWVEQGGPKVSKPTRKGFGTELIERQLKDALGGKVTFRHDGSGLSVHLTVPQGRLALHEGAP